jgi:hypothetical protein
VTEREWRKHLALPAPAADDEDVDVEPITRARLKQLLKEREKALGLDQSGLPWKFLIFAVVAFVALYLASPRAFIAVIDWLINLLVNAYSRYSEFPA